MHTLDLLEYLLLLSQGLRAVHNMQRNCNAKLPFYQKFKISTSSLIFRYATLDSFICNGFLELVSRLGTQH